MTDDQDVIQKFISLQEKQLSKLQRYIINTISTSRQGQINGKSLIPAEILYNYMKNSRDEECTEQMFLQYLFVLENNFPSFFNYIDVPEKWQHKINSNNFPESVVSENKFFCLVNNPIDASNIYETSDQGRKWKPGEKVWVPKNNPITLDYIEQKYLKMIF